VSAMGICVYSYLPTCHVSSRRVSQPATPGAARVVNQGAANKSLSTRSVSFAEATAKPNSNHLKPGKLQPSSQLPPQNPYLKKVDSGTYFAQRSSAALDRVDKIIALKKNNSRAHIHRYTLRFKTIKATSDDEGHQIDQETLQRFFGNCSKSRPKNHYSSLLGTR
jgi:hypothetical protein